MHLASFRDLFLYILCKKPILNIIIIIASKYLIYKLIISHPHHVVTYLTIQKSVYSLEFNAML